MPDDADPPRRSYDLKLREFGRVNPPASSAASDEQAVPSAIAGKPMDVRDLARLATGEGRILKAAAPPVAENDVHGVLRENHTREAAAGMYDVPEKPRRKSKRWRDYLLIVIPSTAVLAPAAVFGFQHRAQYFGATIFVSSYAGIVLIAVGTAWVIWAVMDDY